ncbi:hypothetical protein GCM10009606_45920 [Nocardioides aquiterrae]|uniref:SCP2 domain-containing protein n=1 Tax=Nocardioides aquiterrae TaxID=203799 RepID=A0ABN1USQ7_9ACTN
MSRSDVAGVSTQGYPFELSEGDEANGLASILAMLLGQNLEQYPDRIAIARRVRRPVAVYSTDTDTSATIVFGTDGATVHNGIVGRPSVTVMASVDQITDVSQLKMMGAGLLPAGFFTKRGLHVLGEIARHRLVVKGLLTHTATALRFIALVSVVE